MNRVFLLYDFDPMDGSMGREYLHSIYRTEFSAEQARDRLNKDARDNWMRTCSPAGRANYTDPASIRMMEVKE